MFINRIAVASAKQLLACHVCRPVRLGLDWSLSVVMSIGQLTSSVTADLMQAAH